MEEGEKIKIFLFFDIKNSASMKTEAELKIK